MFYVCISDEINELKKGFFKEKITDLPIFVMSNNLLGFTNNHHINIPDTYVTSKGLYDRIFYPVIKEGLSLPWDQRKEIIFWRGSSTGTKFLTPEETPEQALVKIIK
jgi:hypothetical protein